LRGPLHGRKLGKLRAAAQGGTLRAANPGGCPMTNVDDELQKLRARCRPHLARLAILTASPPETRPPAVAAAEVAEAAGAVVAQAEAAGRAVVSATAYGQRTATGEFLTARLARLKTAADNAVSVARKGDGAALRASLRQFDSLTTALWTVHQAVTIPGQRSPRRRRPVVSQGEMPGGAPAL